ncbi:hypothetical protein A1359_15920 [Methylomonas lenta]|jgi:flagellar basal body-associated protein FliL|uniref:Uncharacterized protein n=1 Tax=Methylomonas lenta TaxID=980561 RepID=A0A177MZN1_9GAMM|nr:hypothetical protein [Methylomonas lenta]OAI10743.1 hypothetical protein A1359_15920 [Methylomonas lenta]
MNTKLMLISVITLTAAASAVGTYYLTSNGQLGNSSVATAANSQNDTNPAQVVVNQDPEKPLTIIVKTEIAEKPHKPSNIGHIRDLKQPHYEVMPSQ